MTELDEILARVPEDVKAEVAKSGTRGRYMALLDAGTRAILEDFQEWLVGEYGLQPQTAQPYKSYAAGGLVKLRDGEWDDLTTNQQIGLKALIRYAATLEEG
jgi:hypothetical protein